MKIRLAVAVSTVCLVIPAVALAGTNSFKTSKTTAGTGDVSFKVKTNKKGVAVKVTSIEVKGLKTECLGDRITPGPTLSASLRDMSVDRVQGGGTVYYRFGKEQKIAGKTWLFGGVLDKKGRVLRKGQLGIDFMQGTATCQPLGRSTLKRVTRTDK